MAMRGEVENAHIKETWSTLLRKQIITHTVDGEGVLLQSEIIVETGYMISFATSRVPIAPITAVTSISLLLVEQFVRCCMYLPRPWDRRRQGFSGDRHYVNISLAVYESCYLYLGSLAGISDLRERPWNLDPRHHEILALAVYLRVMQDVWQHSEMPEASVNSGPQSFLESFIESAGVRFDRVCSWCSHVHASLLG